jgi:hypothetical protein
MATRGRARSPSPRSLACSAVGFAASSAILIDSFKQGMRENGFSEGHDYVLEVRWAEGDSQHNFGALFAAL